MTESRVCRTAVRRAIAFAWIVLFLVVGDGAASAKGVVRRGPVPEFVIHFDLPQPSNKRLRQVANGRYDLLYDWQVRVEGPLETNYLRRAYKVMDRSALENAAQVQVEFDPSYEDLVLHTVRILRGDRAIDVIDQVDIDIIRKEGDLEDGVLTGVRTVLLRLPNVRVGDVIDASWSWSSRPPLWPGHYFGSMDLSWSVPVGATRFRLDLPAGQRVGVFRYRGAPPATLKRAGARDIREWVVSDPDPVAEDDNTPQWHNPSPRITVSTMADWGAVVRWALPLYSTTDDFPAALADDADRIAREGGGPEVRAIKALRLVQDRIRYTSLSIGTGSYRPRRPGDVIRQGWGDCKDKAQLLVTLLRRLGIEAWPALTDSDEGAALRRQIPSPVAFDHVVVQIRIGGRSFWVDPTIAHQGGSLAGLAPLTYRNALPIRPGQRELEAIPLPPLARPNLETVETYRFTPAGFGLEVATHYSREEADLARSRFANGAISNTEAEYLRYYAGKYPGLKLHGPLRIVDDRAANRLTSHESYALAAPDYADGKLLEHFPITASLIQEVFTYPNGDRRVHPMALTYPVNRIHRINFITPGMSVAAPDELQIDGKAFSFELESERDGDRLSLVFSLVGRASLLAPEDFAAFRKDADELSENSGWTLSIGPDAAMSDALALAIALLATAGVALFAFGIAHAVRHKDSERDGEILYPVPPTKFLLLSIATWSLYQYYWFWRNWRWLKRHGQADMWPFWRAFFGVFWLYPLFIQANKRAARRVPVWLGIAAAVLFPIWIWGTSIGEEIVPGWSGMLTGLGFFAALFVLPALLAVNRCNPPEIARANGRWGWLAIAALVAGIAALILILPNV